MMKRCANCNETIRATARKCQLCGFRFDVTAARWPTRVAILAAAVLGAAAALVAFSALTCAFLCVTGLALLALAGAGARANHRRMFRSSGTHRAVLGELPRHYCCPACTPS